MNLDLIGLDELLKHIVADLEQPSAELDAASAADRVDVTLYRAAVQVALVRWHARTALQYVDELKKSVVAQVESCHANATEDAGSTPADDLASRFVVPGS